jgi:hypothetical protein
MGLEPTTGFDATDASICDCENCQQPRAANALHADISTGQLMAIFDADFHQVKLAWPTLPSETRKVILALIPSAKGSKAQHA